MNVKKMMTLLLGLLLFLGAGCSIEENAMLENGITPQDSAIAETKDGGYFKLDGEFVKTVGTAYKDITTSDTDLYLLLKTSTGSSYLYEYPLSNPSSLTKYLKGTIDYIDYIDSTWGLLALDLTYNEIVLKYGTRGNVFLDLPFDLSASGCYALDITGKAQSSTSLYICFTYTSYYMNTPVSYAIAGTYNQSTGTMTWASSSKNLGHYSNGISLQNDYTLYTAATPNTWSAYFYKRSGIYGTPIMENLGSYTGHSFTDYDGSVSQVRPIAFDLTNYSYDYFYILTNNNAGNRKVVRIRKSNINF